MKDIQDIFAALNPAQKEAVETTEGPVLVVAGPGTGKTQVIAARIAKILAANENLVDFPSSILCITFTESGVAAMRRRLQSIIGKDAYLVNINTFHGFCNEVIRAYPDKFPQFKSNPSQLQDIDRIKLIRQLLDSIDPSHKFQLRPFGNKYQYQFEIIKAIQDLKKEGVSPEQLEQAAVEAIQELEENPKLNKQGGRTKEWQDNLRFAQKNLELVQLYKQYQEHLLSNSLYDYDDMINAVVEGFTNDEELRDEFNQKYLYVLIDEYQDTNGAQNALIKQLGNRVGDEGKPNIFAVGDDDQAIYRFQGANVDNLLFFEKQFSDVKTISIDTNYRSTQQILDLAQDSISNNQNRLVNIIDGLHKQLTSYRSESNQAIPAKPEVYRLTTGEAENRFIHSKISELVANGAQYSDIAILYRKHSDAEDIIDYLLRQQIPIKLAAGSDVLDELNVRRLINLLHIISYSDNKRDSLLFEAVFYEFLASQFSYTRLEVFKLVKYVNDLGRKSPIDILDVLLDPEQLKSATGSSDSGLARLGNKIVEWRSLASNTTLSQFMAVVIEESGLLAHLFKGQLDIDQINAVNSFYAYVKEVSRANRNLSLNQFLQDIQLLQENSVAVAERKIELDQNGVNLMTAHAAKGLEFKHVFLVKCFHGNWGGKSPRRLIKLPEGLLADQPESKDLRKQIELEDDRRLFFVALTRAQDGLYLSSAELYHDGPNKKEAEESQFITELKPTLFIRPATNKYEDVSAEQLHQDLVPVINAKLADNEQIFLKASVEEFRLSASALNEYIECPLKFKFNRLLKVPIPSSKHLSLGNATHYALEQVARQLQQGEQISIDNALHNFNMALNKEPLGGEEYLETKAEGERILTEYLTHYLPSFAVPAAVEHYVSSVALEVPGMEPIILTGKIDKLEWVDKDSLTVRVVDYKTTKPKSKNAIIGQTKAEDRNIWRQLVFYKLLGDLDPNFRPEGKSSRYKIVAAQVDFLKSDNGKFSRVEIEITDKDVAELIMEIAQVMQKIRQLDFYSLNEGNKCADWEMFSTMSTQSIMSAEAA